MEQAKLATQNITKELKKSSKTEFDVFIVGAGPAGIAASLMSKKSNLNFKIVDQDSLGGSVYTFPRSKIIMTSPMELPLFGQYNENVPSFIEHIQYMDSIGFIPYDIVDNHYINNFNMQIDMLFINKKHPYNQTIQDKLLIEFTEK